MPDETKSVVYWDRVADESEFTFPVNYQLLEEFLGRDAHVVDLGCGYGRIASDLQRRGFTNVVGIDPAASMIERGRCEHPDLDLRVWHKDELPMSSGSVDAVLMVGVLSCVLNDAERKELVEEAARVLKHDGLLYVSDVPIQRTPGYRARYTDELEEQFGEGALSIDDDGVVRHLSTSIFRDLTADFAELHRDRVASRSLDGNSLETFEYLGQPAG